MVCGSIASWLIVCVYLRGCTPIYVRGKLTKAVSFLRRCLPWPATHPPRFHSVSDEVCRSRAISSFDAYPESIRDEISIRPRWRTNRACFSVVRGFVKPSEGISAVDTHWTATLPSLCTCLNQRLWISTCFSFDVSCGLSFWTRPTVC